MTCQRCNSARVASISSKASDLHSFSIGEHSKHGYLPSDMGIGGGDYTELDYCLDCGQIQGKFPLPKCALESGKTEEEIEDEEDEWSVQFREAEAAKVQDEARYAKYKFEWFDGVVVEAYDGTNGLPRKVLITTIDDYEKDPFPPALVFVDGNICSDFPFGFDTPFKVRFQCNISDVEREEDLIVKNAVWKIWETPKKREFVDLS